MNSNIQREVNRLRGLKSMQDKSETELIEAAKRKIQNDKEKEMYNFVLEGLPVAKEQDKKILENILREYLDGVYIENKRQLFMLKDLVYIEYKKRTIRKQITSREKDKPDSIPEYAYKALNSLIEKGQELSNKIFGSSLKDDKGNLQKLFSRIKLWLEENQGTRSFRCPSCAKMLLAKIRMDKYETSVHPYFKDQLLTNEFLMEKYIEGKPVIVDEEFIAKVLQCSVLYTDWYLPRHFNKNHPLYKKYLDKKKKELKED